MRRMNPEKKKRLMTITISGLIIFLMVMSAFGVIFYGYTDSGETIKYNNHKFKLTQLGYMLKVGNNRIYLDVHPQEAEGINITYGVKAAMLNANTIFLISDINSSYKQEIAMSQYNLRQMMSAIGKDSYNAFTTEYNTLPALSCENSTSEYPIIQMVETDTTGITMNDTCIILNFDSAYNLRRASGRLMLTLLGVMNE